MRLFFTFFLTFFSSILLSKEAEKLTAYCQNFSYSELENGLNDYKNQSSEKIEYDWIILPERELVNDFFEQVIRFRKSVQSDDNPSLYSMYEYRVKLIKHKKGQIAFYQIIEPKNIKVDGEWVETEIVLTGDSTDVWSKVRTDFLKTYSQPLKFDELFEMDIVFGSSCGWGVQAPEYSGKLSRLLEANDTTSIINWLSSTTVEIQMYGIQGILAMQKKGYQFDDSVFELLKLIEEKEGNVSTCSGCTYGYDPIGQTVKMIRNGFYDD